MANPFLMEDPVDYAEPNVSSNPFLFGADPEPIIASTGVDNPFLASVSTAPGTNPFADYTWDEPIGNDPGLLTPPHISNINDPENDFIVSSDDEASKPRRPPPPRPSMPKETQELILSVTGQLKATSDHLLERLPPTRAPSPTSFADLHSPSPTPDFFGNEEDLLPITPEPASEPEPMQIQQIPVQHVPTQPMQVQPQPMQIQQIPVQHVPSQPMQVQPQPLQSQQPMQIQQIPVQPVPTQPIQAQPQPSRPPPPRPPARPSPPQPQMNASLPQQQVTPPTRPTSILPQIPPQPHSQPAVVEQPSTVIRPPARPPPFQPPAPSQQPTSDEIDLFGAPAAPQPKSKDAILNLYSQPKTQPKDLLSDDFDLPPPPPVENTVPSIVETTVENQSPIDEDAYYASQYQAEQPIEAEVQDHTEIFGTGSASIDAVLDSTNNNANNFSNGPFEDAPDVAHVQSPGSIFGVPSEPDVISSYTQPIGQESHDFYQTDNNMADDIQPTNANIFGTNMETTPEIFGTSSVPMDETPSTIFDEGLIVSEATTPHIFGTGTGYSAEQPPMFGTSKTVDNVPNMFGVAPPVQQAAFEQPSSTVDAFDAFTAKFEQADDHKGADDPFDPFSGLGGNAAPMDAWGSGAAPGPGEQQGFGADDSFDAFLSMSEPPRPPQPTPIPVDRADSMDSEEGGFNVVIKPREGETYPNSTVGVPILAPPPLKSPAISETDQKFNPFDKNGQIPAFPMQDGFQLPALSQTEPYEGGFKRSDSQETPTTPLFDEDVSQPLEEFPRIHYLGDGWEMQLRHPNKKKITGQRFWKKIFVKLVYQGDNPVLQLFNLKEDKDPFQELPLQACYSVSEISAQQYDQFGKIFTIKLQYIFYKERPGVRPGQVTKAERITTKLSQFAAYAIQGDYQGVKEFGSDLKKLGLPVEHAPQISQLLKLGCMSFEDLKQFSVTIEECLFRMPVHRDRALNYKMEEVQITVVDEMYVEQDAYGHVEKQIARVRLFFLAFLSGMPDVELGMNDLWRQGKEVVGRHDIIPVVTEEWIRLESVEFHNCVQLDEYEQTRTIKFKPPDACYIELMRFRIRPPKNRELPLQLKAVMCITGNKVELRADVLVPGFTSRKLGQIPCEDVMIRFPIPECWIYLFRVEKHFRYGSVKSAHRRTGKIKGIERFLGAVDNLEPSLMEVTSGQAKYEHQHRAIVWRMPRLPKEGQGAYTTHNLVCRMQLTSFDQIPDSLAEYAYVEFTMPATTASHTTVRSVSLVDSPSDAPPEKYVRQLARLEYRVGIEHTQGEEVASYVQATQTKPKPPPEPAPAPQPLPGAAESDSDSSG